MQPLPAAPPDRRHHVLVVGGGFGGLYAAQVLSERAAASTLTLVDRRNFHLFQPLLYQVATGALSPGEIAQPLRSILRKQQEHDGAARRGRRPRSVDAHEVAAVRRRPDRLRHADRRVRARTSRTSATTTGRRPRPGLKSLDDALEIRRRILIAFEAAEREHDPERRQEWMTFVIVGGGPTGVELAGALGEIANDTLRRDFRSIDPSQARIILVEAMDRILPTYPPDRSASAKRQLERLGVEVRTDDAGRPTSTTASVRVEIGDGARRRCRRGRRSGRPASWCRASSTAVAKATGAAHRPSGADPRRART